jgi:protoheme IX farnesyltransferase
LGLSLIIASGCVVNNWQDREADARMERTKNRALARGDIPVRSAMLFAAVLGAGGVAVLWAFVNGLALMVALSGCFVYLVLYWYVKRHSAWSTAVGSLAGAVPPVVGYVAILNRLDAGALILFLILALWQIPHFYAIGIFRRSDYAAAGLPVLPVTSGITAVKIHMACLIAAFAAAAQLPFAYGYAGCGYSAAAAVFGLAWLVWALAGFWAKDSRRWSRQVFFVSLVVLMGICIALIIASNIKQTIV